MFYTQTAYTFDWARAIERNSEALKGIIATLFAMLEQVSGERLPESLYRGLLRILRPAESAVRRLIVIAARGLVVKPTQPRPMPKQAIKKGGHSRPSFKLFDPVKTFSASCLEPAPRILPRIHIFSYDPRVAALWAARSSTTTTASQDGLINAQRLIRRLHALKSALDNLPHQARRLVRARRVRQRSPLRPGPPPGHRKRKILEIDEILTECHGLARDALKVDTS